MSSVTFTLTKDNYYGYNNPFNIGALVRVAKKKRVWGEIQDISKEPYQHTISLKAIYRPSPKSRLNNKGKFSKFKMKIIKL